MTTRGETGPVPTTTAARLRAALVRYAERCHAPAGGDHHVASPLGAWLLLALCGPALAGPARAELSRALGVDAEAAAALAGRLLDEPHGLVLSAAALWHRLPGREVPLGAWLAALPPTVERGDIPDQAGLDAWARERTLGLIERFPLTVDAETALVLATALATRVSWQAPFRLTPAADLGPSSAWAGRLRHALRTPAERHDHARLIATTARAGEVAVHAAAADPGDGPDGLLVVSVAAAPDVAPAEVLAAAHEVAIALAVRGPLTRRSLFDLPLGDGPAWTLREQPAKVTTPSGRDERCEAVLPAWSAQSLHALDRPELGFPAAAAALAAALGLPGQYAARQAAMARYTRVGFEAAAVSAMLMVTGLPPEPRDGVLRVAELRFGHPYAVVAVATQEGYVAGDFRTGPWHGLPVFSAWVAEPDEAEE